MVQQYRPGRASRCAMAARLQRDANAEAAQHEALQRQAIRVHKAAPAPGHSLESYMPHLLRLGRCAGPGRTPRSVSPAKCGFGGLRPRGGRLAQANPADRAASDQAQQARAQRAPGWCAVSEGAAPRIATWRFWRGRSPPTSQPHWAIHRQNAQHRKDLQVVPSEPSCCNAPRHAGSRWPVPARYSAQA